MNKNKRTLLFLITKIIAGFASIIAISIRSMYINPTQYSDYYFIVQFIGIINIVLISWISESCARYYDSTSDKKVFYSTYLTSLFVGILLSIFTIFSIGYFIGDSIVYDYAWLVIGVIILSSLSDVLSQIFRMTNKVVMFSIIMIFSSISNIIVFILLPKSMGISSLFLTTIFVNSILVIFSFFYLKIYKYYSIKTFSVLLLQKSLKYSLPLIIVWGSIWIFSSSNTYVIKYLIGDAQVSYYNMAHTITFQSLGIIPNSFIFSIFPTLVSFWNLKEYKKVENEIGKSLTISLKFFVPAAIGLCCISPFLYGTIINANYNPNNEGSFLIIIFSLGLMINFIHEIIIRIWNLEEKTTFIAISGAASSLFSLVLSILLLYIFRNYLLAGIVYLITVTIRTIIVFFVIRRKWKIRVMAKEILVSLIFSITMGGTVFIFLFFSPRNILFLFIGVIIGVVVYTLPMLVTKQLKREIALLLSFFVQSKSKDSFTQM